MRCLQAPKIAQNFLSSCARQQMGPQIRTTRAILQSLKSQTYSFNCLMDERSYFMKHFVVVALSIYYAILNFVQLRCNSTCACLVSHNAAVIS